MIATKRINLVWAVLSGLTVVSWVLAMTQDGHRYTASAAVTAGVLVAGAIKVRLIVRTFMEVSTAPRWLQRFTDIWIAVFWIAVLVIYLW